MSKRGPKLPTPKKQKQKVKETRTRMKLLSILLGICTLVGGAVVFLPRPTVLSPTVPFDNNNSFSVSFDISNNGYIPLEDCGISLGVGQIAGKDAHLDPSLIPSFQSRFIMPKYQHHRLGMDERFTFVASDIIGNAGAADIAIIVTYKPWFLPLRREKIFRFVTLKQSDKQLFWRSWPVDEPLPFNKE